MKFNWGTGIFLFMLVFVLANVVFMVFAFRQEVNLVEEDYYEKGVDYGEQMKVIERSKAYTGLLETAQEGEVFHVRFDDVLTAELDSGTVLLYRPSSKRYDISFELEQGMKELQVKREDLIRGRYELKMDWWMKGEQYELLLPVSIR